jgi:hypothetical protein
MARILSLTMLVATLCAAQTMTMRGINTHYEWKPYTSRSEWDARRVALKQQILTSAGLDPMPPKMALNPRYVKQIKTDLAVIDTVLLETMPGFFVGMNLYRPLKPSPKMPAVFIPHGHWAGGRVHHDDLYSPPALAMNLARQGYVALTMDMVGYNDTDQHEHKFGGREEDLWSYTPLGLQLWSGINAIDLLQSLPDVDPQRIAATGASGGGTQTFLLAAVDDRIKVAAPVNMISSYMQGGCVCEGAPGLRVNTFNVELAAIIAPRPMLMVSCTGDWTQHTPQEEFPLMQKMYELHDAKVLVENAHFDAKHNYNADSRAAVYRFLAKHLQPSLKEEDLVERPIGIFDPKELLAGTSVSKPPGQELFAAWKALSRRQAAETDVGRLRERMGRVFHLDQLKTRKLNATWKHGKGNPMLILASAGFGVDDSLLKTDRPVLVLRIERQNEVMATQERSYHTYNLAEGILQVHEILRAIEAAPGKDSVEITPMGDMLLPGLFASALSTRSARLNSESLNKVEGAGMGSFFVPGIERAGGIVAASRMLSGR